MATSVSSLRPAVNGNGADGHHNKKSSAMAQPSRNPVPPPVEDTTSWPTVGMSVVTPSQKGASSEASGTMEGSSKGDEQGGRDDDKNDRNGSVSKKGVYLRPSTVVLWFRADFGTEEAAFRRWHVICI